MLRIIASAAYIGEELSAEFGRLPPAFLPIGVSRLYEEQIASLGAGAPIYLTIPEDFIPQPYDQKRLTELGVILLPVPVGLRLGESIIYALNSIAGPSTAIQLLHGDTLIEDIPSVGNDLIAVHDEGDDYSWAIADLTDKDAITGLEAIDAGTGHEDSRPVVCGYFAFASTTLLVQAITRARGDFIAGLNLYLRDRAVHAVRVKSWRDFGHIQTYFRSRRTITTARAFNSLHIDAFAVQKSSEDRDKMLAEAAWFKGLPPTLQPFSARLLQAGEERGKAFYRIEYQYAPTLSELFVFSSVGRPTWRNILNSCADFLASCATIKGPGSGDAAVSELACDKTITRLERFSRESGFDIGKQNRLDGRALPSLLQIAQEAGEAINLNSRRLETIMHGDFCLSNILYNSRAGRIIVIDPRGYVRQGVASTYGDIRYDLAKLSHSIIGYYDFILSGRYVLQRTAGHEFSIQFETNSDHEWLQKGLAEMEIDGVRAGSRSVWAIMIGLFLSMLPLHADRPDRQAAFIANSLRLYGELEGRRV